MDRIEEALRKLKSSTWIKIPYLPAIESYLDIGDPAALKKITPYGQRGSFWGHTLAEALRPPNKWAAEMDEYLWRWVGEQIGQEKPSDDFHSILRRELEAMGENQSTIAARTILSVRHLLIGERPSSAGRFLLSLPPAELHAAAKQAKPGARQYWQAGYGPLAELLTTVAPDLLAAVVDDLLQPAPDVAVLKPLLKRTGDKYLRNILAAFEDETDSWNKFHLGQTLYTYDKARFGELALVAARTSLKGPSGKNNHGPVGAWMVQEFGEQVLPDLTDYFLRVQRYGPWGPAILDAAVAQLGQGALPVLEAALQNAREPAAPVAQTGQIRQNVQLWLRALGHLIALKDPAHDERIDQVFRIGLAEPDSAAVIGFLNLIGQWKPQRMEMANWGLLQHKSKPVRGAAARALSKLGDAALPQARELLRHKKADVRSAAVTLLASSGTDAALAELESRLDEETNEDVRDQMLLGLSAAWKKQGRVLTREDVEQRIEKTKAKLDEPAAKWVDPASLPQLHWNDGEKLSRDAVAYLIYRQSRATQMRADVEAAPMYSLLDRKRTGDFARAILQGFLGSKQDASDRWALALVGLLGDDRIVPELSAQIREWVDNNRGKLAEYAVQALALLGSDVALLAVDAMAIRYRSKMKNVGRAAAEAFVEAAQAQGVTPEELGDRVVPWLGFEPGHARIIEAGKSRIEAGIGLDFKLTFKDLEKNKPLKSLPKTALPEVLQEFKDLSANLKEVVKAQLLRLENLLVRQRRWPLARWRELFLQHPLLLPFAVRLVWGHYNESGKRIGTFRALADHTLTTNADGAYGLADRGVVGMIHPLELSDDERRVWQNSLADYEIDPPFPQLERNVVHCTDEQSSHKMHRELRGTSINGMTFKGRAERLGWYRGSVCDGGGITSYYKSFPASGADVFLGVEDFYIGIDMYSSIKLGDVCFVKHGTVKVGSYTYDEPGNDEDARIIPLGEVPPIVFSEVMGDLQKIAGKTEGETEAKS
jgi:hypothetical protein